MLLMWQEKRNTIRKVYCTTSYRRVSHRYNGLIISQERVGVLPVTVVSTDEKNIEML